MIKKLEFAIIILLKSIRSIDLVCLYDTKVYLICKFHYLIKLLCHHQSCFMNSSCLFIIIHKSSFLTRCPSALCSTTSRSNAATFVASLAASPATAILFN